MESLLRADTKIREGGLLQEGQEVEVKVTQNTEYPLQDKMVEKDY